MPALGSQGIFFLTEHEACETFSEDEDNISKFWLMEFSCYIATFQHFLVFRSNLLLVVSE